MTSRNVSDWPCPSLSAHAQQLNLSTDGRHQWAAIQEQVDGNQSIHLFGWSLYGFLSWWLRSDTELSVDSWQIPIGRNPVRRAFKRYGLTLVIPLPKFCKRRTSGHFYGSDQLSIMDVIKLLVITKKNKTGEKSKYVKYRTMITHLFLGQSAMAEL